jgi:pimeloyl-ACP methyl ester carboxylesterase
MTEIVHEQFILLSSEGEKLRANIRFIPDGRQKPVVLFLHGFKGFKDWGGFPDMLTRLAEVGFVTIAFNFSHNGISEDLQNFTELDRFAHNTPSREIDETFDVLQSIAMFQNIPIDRAEIDVDRIGLMGHSRGAGVAIIVGARSKLCRAVAALSPIATFDRYSDRMKREWRETGWVKMKNARTGQEMPVSRDLLDDLELNAEKLNVPLAASRFPSLDKPLMIVAGAVDITTPVQEAESVASSARGPLTELHVIPQTGHTFGTEHPYAGTTPAFDTAIAFAAGFFTRYLITDPVPISR